ncbi:hypothetical protein BU15DRAFT_60560 [Melanogaster broomeanus]|nr:hypothetical protein BU15DRAFT_60560 [Melanogaster broomeanus]
MATSSTLAYNFVGKARMLLPILNWIASTFVRSPIGDVVATALRAQPGNITLYLAMNRGYPEKADEDNAAEFLRVLRKALYLFQHDDERSAHIELVHMAVSATHARLSCKLEAIDKMPWTYTPHDSEKAVSLAVNDQFDALVMKWNAAGPNEVMTRTLPRWMDGSATPRFVFTRFISIIRLKKVGEGDKIVAHYGSGALMLVRRGFKFFTTILGTEGRKSFLEGDGGFHIEWVGRQPGILPNGYGRSYFWPNSGIDRFGNMWNIRHLITPYLHCELQLIHYLERNTIPIHQNMIGEVSSCMADPSERRGYPICRDLRQQLRKVIEELATEVLGRKRANSGGSDSGSRPSNDALRLSLVLDDNGLIHDGKGVLNAPYPELTLHLKPHNV